jgi:hypothetical protein
VTFIGVSHLFADDNPSQPNVASNSTVSSTTQSSGSSLSETYRNGRNGVINATLVSKYTATLTVSDDRRTQLRNLAQSSIEDFAAELSKIPKLNTLFATQFVKPDVQEFTNPRNDFVYTLLMDYGVKMVPTPNVPGSLASIADGPSYPDGSCRIYLSIGSTGGPVTTSASYFLPVARNFRMQYYFKIQPSDPVLEKAVNDLFQQTVIAFCLKAGMTMDDIDKYIPGLPTN